MMEDYIIDDNDSYNWLLPKPLSTYTQEELAEQLMENKANAGGRTQRIRIGGKKGGILNTDGCETTNDFIEKYQYILDAAGFKKSNIKTNDPIIEKEEGPRIITVPYELDNYTQEGIAHLVMDNKEEDEIVGVKLKNGFVCDSEGCKTVEDFLNKYSKIFDSLKIKHDISDKVNSVGSIENLVKDIPLTGFESKVNTKDIKYKEEIPGVKKDKKRTVKPLSKLLNSYTREELAHLLMDSKTADEDFYIRDKDGILFDTDGLNTVEEFLNKYETTFNNRLIKSEQVKEKTPVVEKVAEEVKEETTNKMKIIDANNRRIVLLLQDLMDSKLKDNTDISTDYNGKIITTEECNSVEDIVNKYSYLINSEIKNEREALLKNREIRRGVALFSVPRGNYYNGTEDKEEPKLNIINEKETEYRKILNENIDFANTKDVYEWLNRLVPYVNTHALTLNSGVNALDLDGKKNLLKIFENNGYTTNLADATNLTDYYRYYVAERLNELETYNFFISDYINLPVENKELTSAKTNAMAEVIYLENEIKLGNKGIELIGNRLESSKINSQNQIDKLERQIELIDFSIDMKADNYFDDKTNSEQEKEAVKLYKIASVENKEKEVADALSAINSLPEDSKIKQQLTDATYKLFAGYKEDKKIDSEIDNYYKEQQVSYKPIFVPKDEKEEQLIRKELCMDDIEKIKANQLSYETNLGIKKASLIESMDKIEKKIVDIKEKYKLETKEEIKPESEDLDLSLEEKEGIFSKIKKSLTGKEKEEEIKLESDDIDLSLEAKEGIIDKLKNSFTKKEKTDEEVSVENDWDKIEEKEKKEEKQEQQEPEIPDEEKDNSWDSLEEEVNEEEIDLSLESTVDNFTPIKSIKKISKDLYEKINATPAKKAIKAMVDKLNKNKKATCMYAGLITMAGLAASSAPIKTASVSINNDNRTYNSSLEETLYNEESNIVQTVENTGRSI